MKKVILTIGLIMSLVAWASIISILGFLITPDSSPLQLRKKNNIEPKTTEQPKTTKAAFGGSITQNGYVSINGAQKQLNVVYEVKIGDVMKFIDYGNDIEPSGGQYGNDPVLYPIGGGNPIYTPYSPGSQGYTTGSIIDANGNIVSTYSGYGDVDLTYVVK